MVVDDHPIWRDGVARDLGERGFEVVATASDGSAAVRIAPAARPDVVLMDLHFASGRPSGGPPAGPSGGPSGRPSGGPSGGSSGGPSGAEATRLILETLPAVRVLVLSASAADVDVLAAVQAGAAGYLVKSASVEELAEAVRRTAAGDAVFTPGLAGLVLGEYRRMATSRQPGAPQLTEREAEVLRLVAKGLTSRQIADRLVISHRTVQNHVQSTLRKLHLHNRVELARYAIEHALDQ